MRRGKVADAATLSSLQDKLTITRTKSRPRTDSDYENFGNGSMSARIRAILFDQGGNFSDATSSCMSQLLS
jgi:hypothetical protein